MFIIEKKRRLIGGNRFIRTWGWRRALRVPGTSRKTGTWTLKQMKPETSLEAKVTKPKLSHFGHTVRKQGSWEKTVMLGKIEGSRKRGRASRR